MRFLCIGNADSIVMINAQILPTTVYIWMYVHKKAKTTSNKGDRCYTQSQYLISLHLKQTLITTRNFSKMSNAYLFDIKVSRYFLRNRIVPFKRPLLKFLLSYQYNRNMVNTKRKIRISVTVYIKLMHMPNW